MPARGLASKYAGMKWLHGPTRWAIYWRDRDPATGTMRCVWCGRQVWCSGDPDCRLRVCVDHLRAVSLGGTNRTRNLVTACVPCNNRRRQLSPAAWIAQEQLGPEVASYIRRIRRRDLTRAERSIGRALFVARPRHGARSIPPHWSFMGAPKPATQAPAPAVDDGTIGAPGVGW
jgi:hypothetical protein